MNEKQIQNKLNSPCSAISIHKNKFSEKQLKSLSKKFKIKKEPFGYLKFQMKEQSQ